MSRRRTPTPHLDVTRSGSSTFTPADVEEVVACIKGASKKFPINTGTIEDITGVQGRTVRAINAANSGVRWVWGKNGGGYFMPENYDDLLPMWRACERTIKKMQTRMAREKAWAEANLPRRQPELFGDEPDEFEDFELDEEEDEDLP